MAKTHEVLTKPAPGTVVAPVHTYDEEQKAKMRALLEHALTLALPESDPYREWEVRWLNKSDTIPRYMRAAKWDLEDAKKRIEGTLKWRREYKPELIPPEEVRIESVTGKIVINGFDKDGRPIIYMRPGLENTERSPRQLRHLVWCLYVLTAVTTWHSMWLKAMQGASKRFDASRPGVSGHHRRLQKLLSADESVNIRPR